MYKRRKKNELCNIKSDFALLEHRNIHMRKFISTLYLSILFSCAFATGEWTIFPSSANFRRGELLDEKIYLLSGNTLFSVDKEQLETLTSYNKLSGLNGTTIFDIAVSESVKSLVIVYSDGNIDILNNEGNLVNLPDYANKAIIGDRTIIGLSERDGKAYISTGFGFFIVDIYKAEIEDTFYYDISQYKDGSYGEAHHTINEEDIAELNANVKVNGIASSSNATLSYSDGVILTTNAESDYRSSLFSNAGLFSYYDIYEDVWKNVDASQVNSQISDGTTWFGGVTTAAIDPNNSNHFFIGTFGLGLFEFEGEKLINYYNEFRENGVESIIEHSYTSRIGGIVPDKNGYTWFANVGLDKPLRCITPSGDVLKYSINGYTKISNGFDKLIQANNDPYLFKWILGIRPWQRCQVGIYYDGGTPEKADDDESVSFSTLIDQDGNNYTPNYFNDIAEDRNGVIWLLTTSGPFVIDSQIEAFKNPGKVRRIKIPRNDGTNLADYLLAGVDCFCMVVDAANRKWIGTKDDGLYLLSADGLTQIEHFTSENSPLISDNILALSYDESTGTLYISCEGGVLSYVSDAIEGADNYNNVICYPNPVRPEFTGDLHITGLMDKTQVRICDTTNHVVYSTICEGGMVTWNLCGNTGKRVKAGVYLVYGIDKEGKSGVVTKFLVVN